MATLTAKVFSDAARAVYSDPEFLARAFAPSLLLAMFEPGWRERRDWQNAVDWLERRQAAAEEWPWPSR